MAAVSKNETISAERCCIRKWNMTTKVVLLLKFTVCGCKLPHDTVIVPVECCRNRIHF